MSDIPHMFWGIPTWRSQADKWSVAIWLSGLDIGVKQLRADGKWYVHPIGRPAIAGPFETKEAAQDVAEMLVCCGADLGET